ncbi:hypothetical protein SAMN05216215_101128 [Saccharopolyspora shandongensis]|uniref:Uncharacterized protein n=1 Tax=Saccharopolyspora shandongensis TaxID=418495 RepID=A0A1H3BQH6_9PSEU|nr:hypothetical protein SAMN05216215_101128 [Saccharopolyspora shandongensis]
MIDLPFVPSLPAVDDYIALGEASGRRRLCLTVI